MSRLAKAVFDREFYLRANPDVAAAKVDPLRHYLKHGAAEQRQPHPLFDPAHYLECCPEASGEENPLLHFLRTNEGPSTHPLFDCEAYVSALGRAGPPGVNPLAHYLSHARLALAPVKDAAPVRFVLLHYHFFKNAGTTIEEILAHSFFENYSRLDTQDFDGTVSQQDLVSYLHRFPRMKAVSSHQFRHPTPEVKGFVFLDLCFLRDPLDRIRSMYSYFREKPVPGEPASELARDQSIGGFIAGLVKDHSYRVSNVQVNMLANGIVNDLPAETDLARATEVMLQTSFLGVVDCFLESLIAGQYSVRPVFPSLALAQQPANVSGALEKLQTDCDADVYAELVRLNTLDSELVNRARAEVQRRFSLVPDGPARMRALQGQVAIPRTSA